MAKDYKETMKGLSEKLKSEPITTPIQEVRPVAPGSSMQDVKKAEIDKGSEAHFNFWAPRSLMKRVKQHSLDSGMSIKEICITALEQFLSKPPGQ